MELNELLDNSEKNPYSTDEIKRICENKIKIIYYKDLANMKNINEALKPFGKCVALIETSKNIGHWIAMLKQPDPDHKNKKVIEWFDSYGIEPDNELYLIPKNVRDEMGTNKPLFSLLCKKSGYDVIYNKFPLQEFKSNINTCGRFCALRCHFSKWPLKKFISAFESKNLSPDEIATMMTMHADRSKKDEEIRAFKEGSSFIPSTMKNSVSCNNCRKFH